MKKTYVVPAACEVAGRWRRAGETVEMTADEAKYLAPPLGSVLAKHEGAQADGKLDGRKRRRRNRSV